MQIFQFYKALDQWEQDLDNPDQWECSTLLLMEIRADYKCDPPVPLARVERRGDRWWPGDHSEQLCAGQNIESRSCWRCWSWQVWGLASQGGTLSVSRRQHENINTLLQTIIVQYCSTQIQYLKAWEASRKSLYLENGERVGCLSLLGVDITVDTRLVEPGFSEGNEGTQPGDVKQPQVEPRPASSRTNWWWFRGCDLTSPEHCTLQWAHQSHSQS